MAIAYLPFGKVRIAIIIFWMAMAGWSAIQIARGAPEVYPGEHLSLLLGCIGAPLLVYSFRLRPWIGPVLFLVGVASMVASCVVTYQGTH